MDASRTKRRKFEAYIPNESGAAASIGAKQRSARRANEVGNAAGADILGLEFPRGPVRGDHIDTFCLRTS